MVSQIKLVPPVPKEDVLSQKIDPRAVYGAWTRDLHKRQTYGPYLMQLTPNGYAFISINSGIWSCADTTAEKLIRRALSAPADLLPLEVFRFDSIRAAVEFLTK